MNKLSRRAFTSALFSAPFAAPVAAGLATGTLVHAATKTAADVQPHAQIRLGRFTVTFLNDGYNDVPIGAFQGRPVEELTAMVDRQFEVRAEQTVRISFNQYLIDDGERKILVDAGTGGGFGETGALPKGLAAIGLGPADIDAVIATHLHFDHITGLVRGGEKVFANAEVYADRRDVKHFTDPAKAAAAPDLLKSSFAAANELARLYPKLQQIEGAEQIVRGVSTVDLSGHTPGHIGVRIEDDGQSLLLVGDMLFHPALHPAAEDVTIAFEADPAAARAMREAFFPRAAEEGALIAATHIAFPGLGRIVKDRGELRWATADWASMR
ncbi:MAG: MBL fold metallo-hydrolase [Pseudomonadota bacterium]